LLYLILSEDVCCLILIEILCSTLI
jgi:hypothetical protein